MLSFRNYPRKFLRPSFQNFVFLNTKSTFKLVPAIPVNWHIFTGSLTRIVKRALWKYLARECVNFLGLLFECVGFSVMQYFCEQELSENSTSLQPSETLGPLGNMGTRLRDTSQHYGIEGFKEAFQLGPLTAERREPLGENVPAVPKAGTC